MSDYGQCECHKTTPNECQSCIDWKAGQKQTLRVEVDASAVQQAIDQALKDLGVLGEVHRVPLFPLVNTNIHDLLSLHARVAGIAFFERQRDPKRYRESLLTLAALAVKTIKLFDAEKDNE